MNDLSRYNSRLKEPRLPRSTWVAWSLFALLAAFIAWASLFQLDEVTTGNGKVIPSSHEQVIQSLEGALSIACWCAKVTSLNVGSGWLSLTAPKRNPACWKVSLV